MIDLKILFLSILSFFTSGSENAVELQQNTILEPCKKTFDKNLNIYVYKTVTKSPAFPGGSAEWMRFLHKNFHYPQDQIRNDTYQTNTIATFIVKSSGELTNFSIKDKSPSEWTSFDSSFIDAIKKSVRWIPGECDGKIVAAYVVQPITVHLQSDDIESPTPY